MIRCRNLVNNTAWNTCIFCEHRNIATSSQRRSFASSTSSNRRKFHNPKIQTWRVPSGSLSVGCRNRVSAIQLRGFTTDGLTPSERRARRNLLEQQSQPPKAPPVQRSSNAWLEKGLYDDTQRGTRTYPLVRRRISRSEDDGDDGRKQPLVRHHQSIATHIHDVRAVTQQNLHPFRSKPNSAGVEKILSEASSNQRTLPTKRTIPKKRPLPINRTLTRERPPIISRPRSSDRVTGPNIIAQFVEPYTKEEAPATWQHIQRRPKPEELTNVLSDAENGQEKPQEREQHPLDSLLRSPNESQPSYTSFMPHNRRIQERQPPLRETPDAFEEAFQHERQQANRQQKLREGSRAFTAPEDFRNNDEPREYQRRSERSKKREGYRRASEDDVDAWAGDYRNTRKGRGRRNNWEDDEDFEPLRREDRTEKKQRKKAANRETPKPIVLPEYISVANLATALREPLETFIAKLEELGFEEVQNFHILSSEDASLIASEYNFEPIFHIEDAEDDLRALPLPDDVSDLPPRPPVVTIMGHVDHGKTTILDYLRKSAVVESEFGGITQHIGAFSVPLPSGKNITFLDTPGHAAFLSMRQRGANVTDIVVLVVAADDSVKPQTIEAIKHAQSAGVPIIVAINKMDKQEANPESVKRDLMANGVEVEDFGGDVQAIPVSGKTGMGLDKLEEAIVTLSEILDHRADPEGKVEGWVLEASTKRSGKVATVLVRRGTLHTGDILVAGTTWTRVRTLRTEAGVTVDSVGPGMPVEVDGWREQPEAGDETIQAPDEQKANDVVDFRLAKVERNQLAKDMDAINEKTRIEAEKRAEQAAAAELAAEGNEADSTPAPTQRDTAPGILYVPFIIKADVSGSSEAIVDSLSGIGNGEVQTQILRSAVGPVSEFDIEHAAAAGGHVISFNTATANHVAALAEEKGVKIMHHNIIYRLVDDVKSILSAQLAPRIIHRVAGEAEVVATFNFNVERKKFIAIAGCKVRNGLVKKGGKVKVLRDGELVHEGVLSSLKNVKKDVQEMSKGSECGMAFDGWEDFKIGDHVQYIQVIEEARTI